MSDYAGLTIKSVERFDNLGRNVSSVGDLNNDGFDDVMVLSSYYDRDNASGAAFVIYGSANGPAELALDEIDGTNGFLIDPMGAFDPSGNLSADFQKIGTFAAALGDVNGDGIDDFAVGGRSRGSYGEGQSSSFVYVIYGSDGGPGASLSLAGLDGSNGFAIDGIDGQVEGLTSDDLNGDGVNDIIISQSSGYQGIEVASLVADDRSEGVFAAALPEIIDYSGFVLFGGGNLTDEGAGGDGVVSVQDIDGTNGFAVQTVPGGGGFYGEYGGYGGGGSIQAIGDVNGDGFGDLFVTENAAGGGYYGPQLLRAELPPPEDGEAAQYIVFGSGTPGEVVNPRAGGDNVMRVDYAQLDNRYYGSGGPSVNRIGDINGDGFDDIAVTDPSRQSFYVAGSTTATDVNGGVVHVLYGSEDGPVETLSFDGPADASEGFSIFSTENPDDFDRFGTNVVAAGDVNGDGVDDFLITHRYADSGDEQNVGQVQLVFGNTGGFAQAIDTNDLTQAESNALGYRFIGDDEESRTGNSISAAGDVNGDGIGDFLIGAERADNESLSDGGNSAGEAYLLYGGETFLEAADNADGSDDNVIDLANIDVNVATGDVPTTVDVASVGFVSALEGDAGQTSTISITLRRDGDLTRAVSVDFDVAGSGLRPADADDFAGGTLPSGTVSFASGSETATIDIQVNGDDVIETDEDFAVTISNAVGGGTAPIGIGNATGFGRITTDDVPPAIFVSGGGRVVENDTTVEFTINREGDDSDGVVVTYDLTPFPAPGSFFAADSDDIDGVLPQYGQTVTFAAGEMSKTVSVGIVDDSIIEPRESFELRITQVDAPVLYGVTTSSRTATITNDDGRPDVIPPGIESDVFGDPHLVTLDGLAYDFQAVGEYVLIETATENDPNGFEVQVRFEAVEGSELASVTTRMAVQIEGRTVEVDAFADNPLIVDGSPAALDADGNFDLDGDGTPEILSDNGDYWIRLNDLGELLKVGVADGFINVCVFLETAANGGHEGDVQGLMGNANGLASDEFALRDGSSIPTNEIIDEGGTPRLSFDFLYGRNGFEGDGFADSWNVGGTGFFTGPQPSFPAGFPAAAISLDDLPPSVRALAEQAALEAGLDPDESGAAIFEAAVLDFALTGDPQFFEVAQNLAADAPVADTTPFGGPALPATFGILADGASVVEGDSGTQTVQFIVFRAGDDTTTATFDYTVSGIGADDFGGAETGAGTVDFAAGETVKTISVTVAGDTTNEADEPITVTISSEDDVLLASSSATTTLVTDDFAPVTVNAPADGETNEDIDFTLDVSDVFLDRDGDEFTVSASASNGATAAVVGGLLTVTPAENYNGPVTVTLSADDGNGGTTESSFGLTVLPVNDGPTILTPVAAQETVEDNALVFDIPADTFEDVDGDTLILDIALGTNAPEGTTAEIVGRTVKIAPPADFNGEFNAIITAFDGIETVGSPFEITVTPGNDAPIVVNGLADQDGVEDTTFTLAIPADTFGDIDGDALELSATAGDGAPAGTEVSIDGGVVTVVPPADFNGDIEVIVTATDPSGESASAAFTLAVAAVNDEPVVAAAIADQRIGEDSALSLSLDGVFSDAEDDMLDLTAELGANAPAGTTAEIVDGILTVTPPAGMNGPFEVTVTAADDEGESVSDTFTLTVDAENDAPTVEMPLDDRSVDEDNALVFDVPAGTFDDPDGDTIALSVALGASAPAGAGASIDGNTVTVTPPADFNGDIEVIVTGSDGQESVDAPFTLTVDPVNDAPDAVDDGGFSVDEGASITIAAADLLGNDTDVDGDALSLQSVGTALNGSVALDVNGNVVFTADGGATGPASFEYTLSDGELTDTAVVSLTVDEENADPYADYEQGTGRSDLLVGSFFEPNLIFGAGGRDTVIGGFLDDALAGGNGNDRLFGLFGDDLLEGNAGKDWLFGGWGDDVLDGGAQNDRLFGSLGDDTLIGGTGDDRMSGGWGSDTFVFNEGDGRDQILDFSFGFDLFGFVIPGDTIQLDVDDITSFEDVMDTATQVSIGTRFNFGDGDKLIVRNTQVSQFDADDFVFV